MSDLSLKEMQKEWHGSRRAYAIGFMSSLILTILSFLLTYLEWLSKEWLLYVLVGLALTQAAVQLRYFLHLGEEAHPRWETGFFFLMLIILLIIAIGTLWIMHDLNLRMMTTHD